MHAIRAEIGLFESVAGSKFEAKIPGVPGEPDPPSGPTPDPEPQPGDDPDIVPGEPLPEPMPM
jgi:hypothetical protein